MSDEEVYEIEDEFDPLASNAFEDLEDEQPDNDYSAPVIPDADRSIVPEPVDLPASERIEKLLKGIPGQQFRILSAVEACMDGEKTLSQVIEHVDAAFPHVSSVYGTGRLVQLLEAAGAIERIDAKGAQEGDEADDEVQRQEPSTYIATCEGKAAVEARTGMGQMESFLQEEPRYIPVYKRILTMCTIDEGRLVQEINAVVNPDPVCAEPKRFSTYFLRRLEGVGAIRFDDSWKTTSYGKRSLELGLLVDADEAGDIEAAADAKARQIAKEARFEKEKAERERYAAEKAEMEAAQEELLAAQAAERGEEPPEKPKPHGSGGPRFAFPYTPPQDEKEDEAASLADAQ